MRATKAPASLRICAGSLDPLLLEYMKVPNSGLEAVKIEFNLKLKIRHNDGCLGTRVRKQPIIALYFEFENVLKFYNLEA